MHVSERPYFEHLRVVEAILSGAVVVSESGAGSEPLAAGIDFLCARPESLGLLAAELAENDDRRRLIQQEAFATLAAHPLSAAAERFASAAAELARSAPSPRRAPWRPAAARPAQPR